MNRFKAFLLTAGIFCLSNLFGEIIDFPDGGVSFYLPDSWECEREERGLIIFPEEECIIIGFFPSSPEEIFDEFSLIVSEFEIKAGKAVFRETCEENLNGMRAIYGEGETEDEKFLIAYFLIFVDEETGLILFGIGEQDNVDDYDDDMELFIESIKPL
ncbi:hypothetical protein JW890_06610 [candidate division WOR-3 bacterium]|nr:hypothetical protein [candidate division WOR-3 bacterium]